MDRATDRHAPRGRGAARGGGSLGSRRDFWVCSLLVAGTLAAYGRVGRYDFINLDDRSYVAANPQVQAGLTLDGVRWAFTSGESGNWHPVTWLSHMLDCHLFGPRPGAHHLVNVAFHAASAVLLYLALARMTKDWGPSAFVAGVFALHPLHVESVAWIAERKDVLSAFFWMVTLLAYAAYARGPSPGRYAAVAGCFTLGLLAKPMLVTLPFVLLLLDIWPLRRMEPLFSGMQAERRWTEGGATRRATAWLIAEKAPLLALSAASCIVTFLAQRKGGAVVAFERITPARRMGNALVSWAAYALKAFWPSHLAPFYPYPSSIPSWRVAGSAIALVAVSSLVLCALSRRPWLAVGWFWYVGTLVPVIGLVQVGLQARADRYTYLPLVGLSIALAWSVPDLLSRWGAGRRTLPVLAAGTLAACAAGTWAQVGYWSDSGTLWRRALDVTDGNFRAHSYLGLALREQGRKAEAEEHYRQALSLLPDAWTHYNLARLLDEEGRTTEGLEHYAEAVRLQPSSADARTNLGAALARLGRTAEAIGQYTEALRLDPRQTEARYNLASALFEAGRTEEAIVHYEEALRVAPDDPDAHNGLGVALARAGRGATAAEHFRRALALQPGKVNAARNLAWLLATSGDARVRDGAGAVALARRACELAGQPQPFLLDVLAAAYAEDGQFALAAETARHAVRQALASGQSELAGRIERRLRLYEIGRPYREGV